MKGNFIERIVMAFYLKLEAFTSIVTFHRMGLVLEVELKAMVCTGFRQQTNKKSTEDAVICSDPKNVCVLKSVSVKNGIVLPSVLFVSEIYIKYA